ncbi:flagella biosynthesis regulator [compost metagenome]
MHREEERLAKLADKVVEGLSSQPLDEQPAPKPGIKIKGNSGSINFGTQLNIGTRHEPRDLVPAQRQALYDLSLKCVELGADSKEIWRRVFAELGVKQIDDITAEQFQQARGVLQARLDQLQDEDNKRRLIGKILRAAIEKDAQAELNNFCDLTFGRTHLNSLQRADLQRTLEFIQGFEVKPALSVPTQPVRLELREFLLAYRSNAFWLFAFGFIVGKFWI